MSNIFVRPYNISMCLYNTLFQNLVVCHHNRDFEMNSLVQWESNSCIYWRGFRCSFLCLMLARRSLKVLFNTVSILYVLNLSSLASHVHSFVLFFGGLFVLAIQWSRSFRGVFGETNQSELAAFTSYALAFPSNFLALVDTYDVSKAFPNYLKTFYYCKV